METGRTLRGDKPRRSPRSSGRSGGRDGAVPHDLNTARSAAVTSAGPLWEDRGLVFTDLTGRSLQPYVARHAFTVLLRRAELRPVRLHDLRHTAATLLLSRGIHPKIVSEMLGHATIAITLDLYSHVTPSMQREAVRELDALLREGGPA
jgi:integrase